MWMDPETMRAVQRALDPGEDLLWVGRPSRGIRLRPSDAATIPFSLMWCGFAIFWETMAFRMGAPFFFRLWGVPFVLVGLYMVFGRFFHDAWLRSKTYYAVTDRRVILLTEAMGRKIVSLQLHTLPEMTLHERGDGSGTITFGRDLPVGTYGARRMPAGWLGSQAGAAPAFDLVPSVREAYGVIIAAQERAASRDDDTRRRPHLERQLG